MPWTFKNHSPALLRCKDLQKSEFKQFVACLGNFKRPDKNHVKFELLLKLAKLLLSVQSKKFGWGGGGARGAVTHFCLKGSLKIEIM